MKKKVEIKPDKPKMCNNFVALRPLGAHGGKIAVMKENTFFGIGEVAYQSTVYNLEALKDDIPGIELKEGDHILYLKEDSYLYNGITFIHSGAVVMVLE